MKTGRSNLKYAMTFKDVHNIYNNNKDRNKTTAAILLILIYVRTNGALVLQNDA